MNELVKKSTNVVSTPQREAANIAAAAQQDAGFLRSLKFNKGHYFVDKKDEVPLGSEFVAHCVGWRKVWMKFEDGKLMHRKEYSMIAGDRVPDRDEMGDNDPSQWPISDMTKQPQDPWVLQYQLPLEAKNGDLMIFITSSIGGKRAVADVCAAWSRRAGRDPFCGMPYVKLRETLMPTNYGGTQRPQFEIFGWDTAKDGVREIKGEVKQDDMNDEIPF
jgi:hypothetical protein